VGCALPESAGSQVLSTTASSLPPTNRVSACAACKVQLEFLAAYMLTTAMDVVG
jgi:hypothetical protein